MTQRVALSDFHEAMEAANVVALWELEDTNNGPPEPPHIWRWETLEPLLETAIEATSMSDAERRVLVLNNPALLESGRSRGSGLTLGFNLQILMPGETARPHRHSMNALRFVMEGKGATTVVDGKPCPMEPGDMILTPGWTWHEHVHEGDARMIWLDVLDVPFHQYLDTGEFEPGPARDLPDLPPDEAFGAPGFVPVSGAADMAYSPLFRYPWDTARAALAALPALGRRQPGACSTPTRSPAARRWRRWSAPFCRLHGAARRGPIAPTATPPSSLSAARGARSSARRR